MVLEKDEGKTEKVLKGGKDALTEGKGITDAIFATVPAYWSGFLVHQYLEPILLPLAGGNPIYSAVLGNCIVIAVTVVAFVKARALRAVLRRVRQ